MRPEGPASGPNPAANAAAPASVAAAFARARALQARGDHGEAERIYRGLLAAFDREIAQSAGSAEVHCQRGNVLLHLGRHDEAVASYDRALAAKPAYPEAHFNRGAALLRLARFAEALASYDALLALVPHHAGALNNRGTALQAMGRADDALASYDHALAATPGYVDALLNRAGVLLRLERWEDALSCYDRARALGVETSVTLLGRGTALHELRRHKEALACFDRALALAPDDAVALNNRGAALQELQRYDDALASYARAVALRPDYAEAHYNDGVCRLLLGDLAGGWPEFEWRWRTAAVADYNPPFARPLWLGREDIAGRTLLLHPEFGLGDTLQFCRYARLAVDRGARVVLQVQPALKTLLSGMPGIEVIARGEPLPDFDFHCPLLSLPLAFGTRLDDIPATVPYVAAAPAAIEKWTRRFGPRTRPRVGLVWSGNPKQPNDRNRSSRLATLRPLFGLPAQFVVLQTEMRAEDRAVLAARPEVAHFEGEFADFADTAALMALMDLVITVDTSGAHLAGAMARPAWVMLAHVPDWRWLLGRDDCPWYPTMRLFRQPKAGDWASVVQRIGRELPLFLQSAAAGA